jgi:hypothetical protein
MRVALALLWIATLIGAFAAGRLATSQRESSVAAFRDALLARDELTRAHRMTAFLEQLDPDTLPAALEAIEAHNVGMSRQEVRLFLLAWSRFDAPGAYAWARGWKTPWRDTLMPEAIYAWGFRDARAALRELDAIDDPTLIARLRPALFEGWLRSDDRAGASEAIAAIEDPRQRGRLTFLLAAETMRDGPDAVLAWADAVPEDAPNHFKTGAFNQAALIVAREDPRRARDWYLLHRERPYSEGSLVGISRKWAEHGDPPELLDWLRSLPADDGRAEETANAIAAGFRVWLRKEPEQAEAWLAAELPDPRLDPALVELVRASSTSSPASAIGWAGRIHDEDLRHAHVVRVGRAWRTRDPDALQAWLAGSGLPEDVSQAILAAAPAAPRAVRAAPPPRARPLRR